MPVMQSTYPFSQITHAYGIDSVPHKDSYFFRRQHYLQYEHNRWIGRPNWMARVRTTLPSKYHEELLDKYDQDHAMILAEGANGLIY